MPDRRTHKHLPGKVGRNCLGDKRSHWFSLDLCEHLQKFRTLLNKLLLWAWALVVVDFLQQWLQQFCLLSQVVLLPCIAIRTTLQQTAVNMRLNNNMSWDNSYSCSPAYLTETVQSAGASWLRSSSTSSMDYCVPWLCTKFGKRAFSFSRAGPATWNALPDHICAVANPVVLETVFITLVQSSS